MQTVKVELDEEGVGAGSLCLVHDADDVVPGRTCGRPMPCRDHGRSVARGSDGFLGAVDRVPPVRPVSEARIVIATPVDGAAVWEARVTLGYAENLRWLGKELAIEAVVGVGDDVVRSRNRLAHIAMREFPRMTHVLWWDDDNWPEDRGCVSRMVGLGVDVVGAPYTSKRSPPSWVHQLLQPCPPERDGLLSVRSVGFGFTLTTRRCLERMCAAERRYTDWPRPDKISNIFGHLYDQPYGSVDPEDEALLSEDFSFCKRWRAMGEAVYIYNGAGRIWHSGTKAWSASDIGR